MCGRFTLRSTPAALDLLFADLGDITIPELPARYNIAPTQSIALVRVDDAGKCAAVQLRWGLIPSWAKDPKIGNSLINARSEGIESKPSFRAAFKKRRCLIPADGFFEWKKVGTKKQPFYINRGGDPFAFAGLWEHWEGPEGAIESCTIITTQANDVARAYHDRMPVVLAKADFAAWLKTPPADAAELLPLPKPSPPTGWEVYPVSTVVNGPKVDKAVCIEPVELKDH